MIYINVTKFVLINKLEKDHSMIETCRLKNVIFIQTILRSTIGEGCCVSVCIKVSDITFIK